MAEYTGIFTGLSSAADQNATNNGSSTSPDTGSITTTNANDMLLGLLAQVIQSNGSDPVFTDTNLAEQWATHDFSFPNAHRLTLGLFEKSVGSTSTYNDTASSSVNSTWTGAISGWKDAHNTGATDPGTGADGGGGLAWNNPGNITANDGSYADCAISPSGTSNYLKATNFGFALGGGDTVDGVLVTIKTKSAIGGSTESSVKLIGVSGSSDKAAGATIPATDTFFNHGGSKDLWSATITPSDVNASTFGVEFASSNANFFTETTYVDSIKITVYFTVGGSTLSGAASLAGTGTLAAAGVVTKNASASRTGTGTLSATGKTTHNATVSLHGTGTLSADPRQTHQASASLHGIGTLGATGKTTHNAHASLHGVGTVSAVGLRIKNFRASLHGIGTVAATGKTTHPGSASLHGVGTLGAVTGTTRNAHASLNGAGTLAAAGLTTRNVFASLVGTGTLVAHELLTHNATASLHGVGTVAALQALTLGGQTSLHGTGTLAATGKTTHQATASLHGTGTLMGIGKTTHQATASLHGVGTVSADATRYPPSTLNDVGWKVVPYFDTDLQVYPYFSAFFESNG